MKRLWYKLTAWWPRPLPTNAEEWERLKCILLVVFGVPDKENSWMTIAGHVGSTPAWKRRRSYRYLANVALRIGINDAAREVVKAGQASLQAQLKIALERAAKEQDGTSSVSQETIPSDAPAD